MAPHVLGVGYSYDEYGITAAEWRKYGIEFDYVDDIGQAGYWLDIYMYTEPDGYGDCYSILSGGTGELIFNVGVYRMGYWGNKTHLNFMGEICQALTSD